MNISRMSEFDPWHLPKNVVIKVDVKGLIRRRTLSYDLCHTSRSINHLLIKGGEVSK